MMRASKCRDLVPVNSRTSDVNDARDFFVRNGIGANRLADYASFIEADSEFCYRVRPGEVDMWSDASHTMRRHLHSGYRPSRHDTSYMYRTLDNVYRLSDIWGSVN